MPDKLIKMKTAHLEVKTYPAKIIFTNVVTDLKDAPELAAALGNIVVVWSSVDVILVSFLVKMIDTSWEKAATIYHQFSGFTARVNLVLTMALRDKTARKHYDDLETILIRYKQRAKTRNKWIHGSWYREQPGSQIFYYNYRVEPGSKKRRVIAKIADLEAHVEKIKEINRDLAAIELMIWSPSR